jgi:hypothetical protein
MEKQQAIYEVPPVGTTKLYGSKRTTKSRIVLTEKKQMEKHQAIYEVPPVGTTKLYFSNNWSASNLTVELSKGGPVSFFLKKPNNLLGFRRSTSFSII